LSEKCHRLTALRAEAVHRLKKSILLIFTEKQALLVLESVNQWHIIVYEVYNNTE